MELETGESLIRSVDLSPPAFDRRISCFRQLEKHEVGRTLTMKNSNVFSWAEAYLELCSKRTLALMPSINNWGEFDKEVLGGNYQNHYDNQFRPVLTVAGSAGHAILKGVSGWTSSGSLYKNMPLPADSQVLLRGTIEGYPSEPVAWTHSYGTNRVFYTSLGHPDDFKEPNFIILLENAIFWALGDKAPKLASVLIPEGMQRVDVTEFDRLRLATKAVILDVRTPDEFAAGHIPGALNIDVNEPDFEEKVKLLDLNQPYLVHCAAGGRSARACTKMSRLKFKTLIDLAPGFNGWKAANKPIEK